MTQSNPIVQRLLLATCVALLVAPLASGSLASPWNADGSLFELFTPPPASSGGGSGGQSGGGASNGADKTAVSGASIEILGPSVTGPSGPMVATILSTEMHTSNTVDVLLYVTLECALWTQVGTVGNDVAEATARVKVWVEIDGEPVLVSDDDQDDGKVVFCDRTHRQETREFDDDDATIEQFLRTRSANAFNWIALDLGNSPNPHLIEVKAELSGEAVGEASSQAGIGHRTLIVEPVHLPPGSTI